MQEGQSQIGFNLPEQRKPGKDSFNTKPRKVEEWVAALPMGNVGETARLVFGALHETNRMQVSWQDRYRQMELLREPVAFVGQALHKRFLGMTFPLQPKTQRIANLAIELYSEMALGYKAAIADMDRASFLFRDKKALTISVHRALHYINRALLTTYQIYAPHPKNIWSDIHRLYRYAESRGLAQTSVTNKEQVLLPKTSCATAYKQALLLALATPYRLRQGEVTVVHSLLEKWSPLAQLAPFESRTQLDVPLFVTDLDSNEEPSHIAFSHFHCEGGQCRLIDLSNLGQAVRSELQQVESGHDSELQRHLGKLLTTDLLHRLNLSWGVPPKRGFYRSTVSSQVELVVGLTAVHRSIGLVTALRSINAAPGTLPSPSAEGLFKRSSTYASKGVKAESDQKEDVWNLYKPQPAQPPPPAASQPAPAQKTMQLVTQTWDVRDESGGGARVARKGADTNGVQVGDLIGMRTVTDTHDADWTMAVVRWIRHGDNQEIELGLQNIASMPRPAAARTRQADGHYSEYQRIIGLPENREAQQPQSILAPAMLFSVGTTIQVPIGDQEHRFQLTSLLENTGSFAQFSFKDLGPISVGKPTPAQEKQTGAPSDFNSLWSEL